MPSSRFRKLLGFFSQPRNKTIVKKTASRRLAVEALEDRTLMAVLPVPTVNAPWTMSSGSGATVVQDPLDANNLAEFHTGPTGVLVGSFSVDQGQHWTTFQNIPGTPVDHPNIRDPLLTFYNTLFFDADSNLDPAANFSVVEHISAAWDRFGNVYVVATQHNVDSTGGALVLQKYDFSTPDAPAQTIKNKILEKWAGADPSVTGGTNRADPILNPVVAVDNNEQTFTDTILTTNNVQTDTMSSKAVYIAWSTNDTAPQKLGDQIVFFNPNTIKVVASPDGINFSTPQFVNDDGHVSLDIQHVDHYSTPQIVFTQGTADGSIKGGQLVFVWNNFGHQNLAVDTSQPDGGVLATSAVKTLLVDGPTGLITDAIGAPEKLDTVAVSTGGQGAGYKINDLLTIQGGTFTVAATLRVLTVNGAGGILSVAIVDPGVYTAGQTPMSPAQVTGGMPTLQAAFDVTFVAIGADTPGVTDYPVTVNITDPDFNIADLDVTVAIEHEKMEQVSIDLVSPGGVTVRLLENRLDGAGNTRQNFAGPLGLNGPNLGVVNTALDQGYAGTVIGTVFDQQSARRITDPSATEPHVAHFYPETDSLNAFNGLVGNSTDVSGTWILRITDNVSENVQPPDPPPQQFVLGWSLHFTSDHMSTSGFGADTHFTPNDGTQDVPTVTGGPVNPYPNANTGPFGPQGAGPQVSVAVDNTLGGLSPFEGTIYVAYTSGAGTNTNVTLVPLNDIDPVLGFIPGFAVSPHDDAAPFGGRAQFEPTIAVDQVTGTLGLSWYDARYDAAGRRAANYFTTSIDGGNTFGPNTFLNRPSTAFDAITGEKLVIEPVPGNVYAAPQVDGYSMGFGQRAGLVMHGGFAIPVFSSNYNAAALDIDTAVVTYAAGPRIVSGDMGPVTQTFFVDGVVYNDSFTADGTREIDGFSLVFDRPVYIPSFTPASVTLVYRDTVTTASDSPYTIPNTDYDIVPLDPGNFGKSTGNLLATTFLVKMKAGKELKGVGTYSYAVGSLGTGSPITDGIKTTAFDPVAKTPTGNFMDQNQNAETKEPEVKTVLSAVPDPADTSSLYTVDDIIEVIDGTSNYPCKLRVTAVDGGGHILAVEVVQQGNYIALPANPAAYANFQVANPFAGGFILALDLTTKDSFIGDLFTAPGNTDSAIIPLSLPYTSNTLPLIIPGPQLLDSTVKTNAPIISQLALNQTNNIINVSFDRDIDITSFDPNNINRVVGPTGTITNYTQGPAVSFVGGGGSGATGIATISGGIVVGVTILNGGSGYTSAPTVVFTGGGGINAAGFATVAGGKVTFVTISNPGRGYTFTSPQTIPDGGTLDSKLFVPDSLAVNDLSVGISLTHANLSSLTVTLIAPDGSQVRLFSGLAGANLTNAVFDQNATNPVTTGSAPFNGTFRPASIVTGVSVAAGGTGYAVGDILEVEGGNSSTKVKLQVTAVAAGAVTGVSVLSPGTYITLPTNPAGVLDLTRPTAKNAKFNLSFANTLTALNGKNYQGVWTLRIADGAINGVAGTLTKWSLNPFTVTPVTVQHGVSATIVDGGAGYQVGDIVFPGSGGAASPFQLLVTSVGLLGDIISVAVAQQGAYVTPPTGTFDLLGGLGAGATATATFAPSVAGATRTFAVTIPTQTRSGTNSIVLGASPTGADIKDTKISSATVAATGSGYTVGDILTLLPGNGSATQLARFRVTTVGATGQITGAELVDPGVYAIYPTSPVGVSGGTGTGAALSLRVGNLLDTNTNAGVEILRSEAANQGVATSILNSAVITTAGTGYAVNDVLQIAGGTFGTAAQLLVTSVSPTGGVTGVTIRSVGLYTILPPNPANVVDQNNVLASGATFTLSFLTNNNGTILPNTFNSTGTANNKPIPPRSTIDSQINISQNFIVQGVTLRLSILHQNIPDLTATLIAPDGTSVLLFTHVGTAGSTPHANFTNTTFDDSALFPIQQATTAPGIGIGVGPFTPQLPLSIMKGHGSFGNWTLRISSASAVINGTLVNWSLTLKQSIPGAGLGEPIADQATTSFRIFTQDPTNEISNESWTAVGPAPISFGQSSGRVGAIAVDPSDPSGNTVFVSGASGGIWKTTNFLTTDPAGPTYVNLTYLGPTYSLNVSSIAVFGRNNDPNQSIIFATTGDKETFVTGQPDTIDYTARGVGFLRSMDGGKTWTLLDSTTNVDANGKILGINDPARDGTFVGMTGFKIIVDPRLSATTGQVIVYAAVSGANGGIWRSLDTGNHWTRLQAGNGTDVVFAAGSAGSQGSGGNVQIVYGAIQGQGVFYTTNAPTTVSMSIRNGATGVPLRRNVATIPDTEIPVGNLGINPGGADGRITLAVPSLNGNPLDDTLSEGWLYALVTTAGGQMRALYMTQDFGLNWTQVHLPNVNGNTTNDETQPDLTPPGGQGHFDSSLAVDPLNPNIVYLGGQTLIRVDVHLLSNVFSQIGFDNSNNDGGQVRTATVRGTVGNGDIQTSLPGHSYTNELRDPDNPFLTNAALQFVGVGQFTNSGQDVLWDYFAQGEISVLPTAVSLFPIPSVSFHSLVTLKDPLTGKTRVLIGDNQGIFTAVDDGKGFTEPSIGLGAISVAGARQGNLQIAQFYDGATQPSLQAALAAQVGGALFYGIANSQHRQFRLDVGLVKSNADILDTGLLSWNDGNDMADGTGVKTDSTGTGQAYYYMWPLAGAGEYPLTTGLPSDFFGVSFPGVSDISRTTGLLQAGDDPSTGNGQWPGTIGSRFAVNPIDPTSIVMSSQAGRIFLTTGPSLGTGVQWFPIGDPGDLDGQYAPAMAFGAPINQTAPTSDFIYAGTDGGNIFVTFVGGGVGQPWKNISAGLDGSPVRQIVTNPIRGSHEAYAVTARGVYWMADSSAAAPNWVNITGNLFNTALSRVVFNDPAQVTSTIKFLTSLQVDWRYAIPDNLGVPTGPKHPVLYVAGDGGVFRSLDKGVTWTYFPNMGTDGAIQQGGLLPNNSVSDITLSVGAINPLDGTPSDQRYGRNMLVATTYGTGVYAIRLTDSIIVPGSGGKSLHTYMTTPVAGPHVVSLSPTNTSGALTGINVKFSGPVDPVTFTVADVKGITGPGGATLTAARIVEVVDPNNPLAHDTYSVLFTTPTNLVGSFKLELYPTMSDFAGNKLDQDQDSTAKVNGQNVGANGEPVDDIFNFPLLSFTINTAPNFNVGPNQTVPEDSGPRTVPNWATGITPGGPADAGQTVTFIIDSNSNPTLFATQPAVSPNGTLTFTPALNANGVATITLHVQDNGGTANGGVDVSAVKTFTITVTAINDRPTFVLGPTQNVLEDAAAQTVVGWATGMSAGPPDESGQTLTFSVANITYSSAFYNTNAKFFTTLPSVDPTTGTLTYQLAPNANGSATVFLVLKDNGGTAFGGLNTSIPQSFNINVTPVNDAPSFTVGQNQRTVANTAKSVAGFLTDIHGYPASPPPLALDEGTQTLTFQVSNDNNGLFSVQPTIDATGKLTYTTAPGANGVATVTVTATDNGGTANGGVNMSAPQTFTITVKPKGNTSTTLGSSINPSAATQPVAFTATVSDTTNGGPALSSSVKFTLTGATTGVFTIPVNNAGQAVLNTSTLNVGTTTVTAEFIGDTNYVGSIAPTPVSQVVNKKATTTAITTSLGGGVAVVGQAVTYTATVSPSGFGGTPTGSVVFTVDGVSLPAVALVNGVATLKRTFAAVAAHTVKATYTGNATTNPSSATFIQTVNSNPIAIVSVSPTNMVSGTTFTVVVNYRQTNSNAIDTTFNGPITLALNTSSVAGATFTPVTMNAVNGVATFTNLKIAKAGTYTLKATTGNLPPSISPNIVIRASSLVAAFASPPVVNTLTNLFISARDTTGGVATNYNGGAVVKVVSAPAGATIFGPLSGTIVNGTLVLTNMRFTKPGSYTLQVISGSLSVFFTFQVKTTGRVT